MSSTQPSRSGSVSSLGRVSHRSLSPRRSDRRSSKIPTPTRTLKSSTTHENVSDTPTHTPSPCPRCTRNVGARGIRCDGKCGLWFHPKCVNISDKVYNVIKNLNIENLKIYCDECVKNDVSVDDTIINADTSVVSQSLDCVPESSDVSANLTEPQIIEIPNTPPPAPNISNLEPRIVQGHQDPLSNFYSFKIHYNNTTANSLEHMYHFGKAMMQNKTTLANEILNAPHAAAAKDKSRFLDKSISRADDVNFMLKLLMQKAQQCPKFREALRASGTNPIRHSTRSGAELFWGTGLSHNDLPGHSKDSFPGQNIHGKLLEIVRSCLGPETEYKPVVNLGPSAPRPLMSIHLPQFSHAHHAMPPISSRVPAIASGPVNTPMHPTRHDRCHICSVPGHNAKICRYRNTGITCYRCGRPGHKQSYCNNVGLPNSLQEPPPHPTYRHPASNSYFPYATVVAHRHQLGHRT